MTKTTGSACGGYFAGMIIAGIDEAGYGPILGPLASAASAFRTPDADPPPCLWERLRKTIGRSRARDGRRLHVNDSKAVYSASAGLAELERAVLCLSEQANGPAAGLDDWLTRVAPDAATALASHPWYARPADKAWPLATPGDVFKIASNAYATASGDAESSCVHYRVRLLPERQFNDHTARTRNKASTLFSLAAQHLDDLIRQFADDNLVIVCDRQGGRSHYGDLLRLMFDEWSLVILNESDASSTYELVNAGRRVRITFCEKAESACLPVAAASMLAKYSREALMRRFNRYWQSHEPALKPTAGYYTDGLRFLADIAELRQRLGVADSDLIRQR